MNNGMATSRRRLRLINEPDPMIRAALSFGIACAVFIALFFLLLVF